MESATQFHEPLRKERRRNRIDDWRLTICDCGLGDGWMSKVEGRKSDWTLGIGLSTISAFALTTFTISAYLPLFAINSWCVPVSIMRPSSSTIIWSALKTVFRRWAMVMTVRPCMRRRVDSSSRVSVSGSRLEVGSSRMRIGASFRKARASARRCACPPLRRAPLSPMTVSYFSGSVSTNACKCAAFAASMISSTVASGLPKRIFAEIVSWNRCGFCGTHAIELRNWWLVIGTPWLMVILPSAGWPNPRRRLTSVDFPAPDFPTHAICCPDLIFRLMFLRAGVFSSG